MGKLIAPQSDPYFNNVELLLSMNGANGSTTFLDSSKNNSTITINGNPQISTAQSKYGGSSAYFNGNESYLDVSNLPSDYLSQDFTIEAWVWVDDSKINSCLFNTFPHNSLGISLNREETGLTNVFIGDGVNWYGGIESDTPLSFNTWQHIALVRSNNTITLYENGIAHASTNYVPIGFSTSCRIGSITYDGGLNSEEYLGYMDDFRITKGIARYTSNFVPQNKEFYDGKIIKNISIKKQNLSILKSSNYYPPQESIYTFKSATTNLLGTILNYAQFEPYTDSISIYTQGNLDGLYASFYTDGSSFIYEDYTTNANNFVIPANSLLIFSTSYDINITVGGGAIIQKYYSGKIKINKRP